MTFMIPRNKALAAASKKLRLLPTRELEVSLEMAAGTMAEAYRLGVEETQNEIVTRLSELPTYSAPKTEGEQT